MEPGVVSDVEKVGAEQFVSILRARRFPNLVK